MVGRQPVTGGATRTAIHWLDVASGAEQDLALLPSEVAPDTYTWSPDGQTVAFVVHTASLAAVCTLSVDGEFHYLGDLNHDGLLGPPVAPVAWAPDGRVVYGALVGQTPASRPLLRSVRTRPVCFWLIRPAHLGAHSARRRASHRCGWLMDVCWLSGCLVVRRRVCTCVSWTRRAPPVIWRASTCQRQVRRAYGVRWDLVAPASAGHHQPRFERWACARLLARRLRLGDLVVRLAIVVTVSVLAGMLSGTAAAQSATATFDAPATTAIDTAPDPGNAATPAPTSDPARPHRPPVTASHAAVHPSRSLTQDQANGLFDGFLVHGFLRPPTARATSLKQLVDDANLVTTTPADWTYQQSTVTALQHAVLQMSNAMSWRWSSSGWASTSCCSPSSAAAIWRHARSCHVWCWASGLANSAPHWTALAIDLNNAACNQLLAASSGSLADLFSHTPTFDKSWLTALLLVAFLLVWAWLYLKMAGRMAMLMVLLVLAPAAQLCWILPQTRGMADRWQQKFWTTLFAQVVVTAALKLAWGFAGATGSSNPVSLLISLCLLFLAANSPELLAGGVARVGVGSLVETALLASRAGLFGPAAGAAGAAAATGNAMSSAAASTVSPSSVPRVMASPVGISGMDGGTGGGNAVETKGFGRGGRAVGQ